MTFKIFFTGTADILQYSFFPFSTFTALLFYEFSNLFFQMTIIFIPPLYFSTVIFKRKSLICHYLKCRYICTYLKLAGNLTNQKWTAIVFPMIFHEFQFMRLVLTVYLWRTVLLYLNTHNIPAWDLLNWIFSSINLHILSIKLLIAKIFIKSICIYIIIFIFTHIFLIK